MFGGLVRNCLLFMLMLLMAETQAGISGKIETLFERDNLYFESESRSEQWLDVRYENPSTQLSMGLSMSFLQTQDDNDEELALLNIKKHLDDKGSFVDLGRLQRADSFGFYILDGIHLKYHGNYGSLSFYGGVPGRIESFRSIEGGALYGFDMQSESLPWNEYAIDGRIGWQYLDDDISEKRLNIGGRLVRQEGQAQAVSFATTYRLTGSSWESIQIDAYQNFSDVVRWRVDYETYEPNSDKLTFKDRFYSLYAKGRQSQLKTGIAYYQDRQRTWVLQGRRVSRDFGESGLGVSAGLDYRSLRGWVLNTQLDQLTLSQERLHSFYIEGHQSLTSILRATLSGVVQRQQKKLVGDNRSIGVDAKLERRVRFSAFPSPLWCSLEASYIDHSRLSSEYRIALRLSYHFDDRTREALQ